MSGDDEFRTLRLAKLERMRALGRDPYAIERWQVDRSARQLLDRFESLQSEVVSFAGRVLSYRLMGKAGFAHVSDGDAQIQCYFRKDDLSDEDWELYGLLDIGDHVGVEGELFLTKTGEKSLHVRQLQPLSKCLHILPVGKEKDGQHWYGLADVEQRYRHRHLDLISNKASRESLVKRMQITSAVRRFFDAKGFVEAETPILQTVAGGAAARTFETRYNAYDLDVKLRISLELYLKRLICGDLPKVYEIGRVFRNEGVSNRHNPEFTLLEWYEAYANLEDVMKTVEELFEYTSKEVFGTSKIQFSDGTSLDFSQPWRRVDLVSSIEAKSGVRQEDLRSLEAAKAALGVSPLVNPATGKRIIAEDEQHLGGLIEKLLEVFVEPELQEPTFVVGYPIETSPLAKKNPSNPTMTRRFEAYVRGREVANAFSEINDPLDQRERFEQQQREAVRGDEDAHPMDDEFIYALECGMPPAGGCGIGLDRMAMTLLGVHAIREVLLFPTMKPEPSTDAASNMPGQE